jgi:hypothetical protein
MFLWPNVGVLEWIANTPIPQNKRCFKWPPNVLAVPTSSPSPPVPFAGLWRVTEIPLDRPLPWTAGRRSNESMESVGPYRAYRGAGEVCRSNPPQSWGDLGWAKAPRSP